MGSVLEASTARGDFSSRARSAPRTPVTGERLSPKLPDASAWAPTVAREWEAAASTLKGGMAPLAQTLLGASPDASKSSGGPKEPPAPREPKEGPPEGDAATPVALPSLDAGDPPAWCARHTERRLLASEVPIRSPAAGGTPPAEASHGKTGCDEERDTPGGASHQPQKRVTEDQGPTPTNTQIASAETRRSAVSKPSPESTHNHQQQYEQWARHHDQATRVQCYNAAVQ